MESFETVGAAMLLRIQKKIKRGLMTTKYEKVGLAAVWHQRSSSAVTTGRHSWQSQYLDSSSVV